MRTDNTCRSEAQATMCPVSLTGALDATVDAVRSQAAALRGALAHRDPERAWATFVALRRMLAAHLEWEAEDVPALLDQPDLLDLAGGTRTMRAWHDLLIDALSDLDAELSEPSAEPIRAIKKADHAAARLVAFCEDYQSDQQRGQYQELDEDVERHDREPSRRAALVAWRQRVRP